MIRLMSYTAAVIDVGSQTTRLLVAHVGPAAVEEADTERVELELGREIETAGKISKSMLAEAAEAVRRLYARARSQNVESVDVFITSPGRQAKNAADLVDAIERKTRVRARILSDDEEARLAFAGAVAVAAPAAPLVAVVDLGGASTEIAVGPPETEPAWLRSVDLGALRLTERMLDRPRPTVEGVEAARVAVAEAFDGTAPLLPGAALVVGGSARALRRVVGPTLGAAELNVATSLLPLSDPDEIADRFGVSKRRAPLLLAAALILAEVQRRLMVPLAVTDGGVREGALLAMGEEAAA